MKEKYILAYICLGLVTGMATILSVISIPPTITETLLAKYKQDCHNDSTPAYTRIVSSRLTMLEAQEDSLRMSATNINATYSIGKNSDKYFPKYLVKETSKIYNHKQPTLSGFETWLKK